MKFVIIDDFGCAGPAGNRLPKKEINEVIADDPIEAVQSLLPAPAELQVLHTENNKVVRVRDVAGDLFVTVVTVS